MKTSGTYQLAPTPHLLPAVLPAGLSGRTGWHPTSAAAGLGAPAPTFLCLLCPFSILSVVIVPKCPLWSKLFSTPANCSAVLLHRRRRTLQRVYAALYNNVPWLAVSAICMYLPGIVLWAVFALHCKADTFKFLITIAPLEPATVDGVSNLVNTTLIALITTATFIFMLALVLAIARSVQKAGGAPNSSFPCGEQWAYSFWDIPAAELLASPVHAIIPALSTNQPRKRACSISNISRGVSPCASVFVVGVWTNSKTHKSSQ